MKNLIKLVDRIVGLFLNHDRAEDRRDSKPINGISAWRIYSRREFQRRTQMVRRIFTGYMLVFVLAALLMILISGVYIGYEVRSIECP